MLPRVLNLEARQARLVAALNATSEPAEVLNRRLIMKLWARVQELEQKQVPTGQMLAVDERVGKVSKLRRIIKTVQLWTLDARNSEIVGVSKSTVANYLDK